MKRTIHKTVAAVLAAAVLIGSAAASGLGTFLRQDSLELSDTARMTHGQLTNSAVSSGQLTENILEYEPESGLRPIVAYGTTLYGRSNLDYVAEYLAGTGKTVTAGVNGSFFTMATGVPMGPVITEGVVRSGSSGQAVGFREDGTAVIGQPLLDIRVQYNNGEWGSVLYNKTMTKSNGAILYSRDFDYKTKNTISGYHVLLKPDSDEIVPGETITAQVTGIVQDTASCEIPEGCFVLAMATETDYAYTFQRQIGALQVGDTVSISCTVAEEWADVTYACGGDELLVENGTAKTSFTLNTAKSRAARTAVGLKRDGTLVLYTVDYGSSGYSTGMTLAELAQRMEELGCVTALNLDGGGSTTFAARYPGESKLTTVNKPSDGAQRKCANFIFLARDTTAAGEAAHLHLYPYDAAVLAGGRLTLTAKATDADYNAAALPDGISYSASGGTVSDDGVFTAGSSAGTAVVRAQADNGAEGSRSVRVVTNPSSISVRDEATGQTVTSLTAAAGKTVDLTAVAALYGYNLTAQDDCFTWSVSGGIGQIDANGAFTAAAVTSGVSGTITCSAGTAKASVTVTVTPLAPEGGAIHGFEPGQAEAVSGTGMAVSENRDLNYVRYGTASLRAEYDLTQPSSGAKRQVSAGLTAELPADADTVGIWVYGDGSGNSLSLLFQVGEAVSSKWITQLGFTGWKYVSTEIPAGASAVTGFAVTEHENRTAETGVLYLDQLIAAKGALNDTTPPSVTAVQSGGSLNLTAADADSGVERVTVTLDGEAQTVTMVSGKASVALPEDGKAHQVRITAADRCGNLTSRTVAISGTLVNPFSDLNNHWSRVYVDYCYREGMLNGSEDGSGNLLYRPDDSMTRQEFAAAVVRFLGVDTSLYNGTVLPFADNASISAWALDAMKAAYSLGLITGTGTGGALYANPTATITRQEAMTILGRTQERGYAEDPLSAFSDGASVASWAKGYVGAMVSRGVISGSNGRLNPGGTVTRGQVAKMLYGLY